MSVPLEPPRSPAEPLPGRPVDVDTGFWLWLMALPLMTCGYVVSLLSAPELPSTVVTYAVVGLMALVIGVLVATFLMLMRSGYRWARTLLTGGGIAAIVYTVSGLTTADPRPTVAVIMATTGIVGSVLIAAGAFLLHRSEAQAYFTR